MPQPEPYAGRLHAFLMQYQVLPSFFFGFLLTVFPRWLGEPDLHRRAAWPVGAGLFGSQILTIAGALGCRPTIILGAILTLFGRIIGLFALARLFLPVRVLTCHPTRSVSSLTAVALVVCLCITYFSL